MKRFNKTILLLSLFIVAFPILDASSQNEGFISFEQNVLTIDNGVIHREVILDGSNGQVGSSVLRFSDDDFNYLNTGEATNEFRFQVYGIPLSGLNRWTFLGMDYIEDPLDGEGAVLKFRGYGIMSKIELHISYKVYPELPVIAKQLTLYNKGDQELVLEGVDVESLSLVADYANTDLYTHYCRNRHIGPYEGDWDDPVIALHLPHYQRGVLLGNEAPGVLKRIAYLEDAKDFCAGLTHPDQPYPFRKWLKPGEAYTTPEVFVLIYKDARGPYEALNFDLPDYIRKHMGLEIFKNEYKPVFVYNTWSPFRKNFDHKLIGQLAEAAEECGIEEFVIDDGWQKNMYTEKGGNVPWWYTEVGDYLIDSDKFPDGLKPVFDDIKARGMKPGLWLSIGSASITSEVYRQHPEWFVQDTEGELSNLHTPSDTTLKTVCFSTEWATYIQNKILQLATEYGLSYTKLDFAIATSAYLSDPSISGCYSTDHKGHKDHPESFIVNYTELFKVFDALQKKEPDLFVDCTFETQGKMHLIDYAFMKHAEGNWLSNYEEASPIGALRVRHLAWEKTPLLPAASCVIGNLPLDSDDIEFDFFSLLGTFPIMLGDIRNTESNTRSWLKKWSVWMNEMQNNYDYMSFRQDLRGFGEPEEGCWDGWQRINSETKAGGIIGVFRQGAVEAERLIVVEGLSFSSEYDVIDAATSEKLFTLSGMALKENGFKVSMDMNYQAKIFEIRKR